MGNGVKSEVVGVLRRNGREGGGCDQKLGAWEGEWVESSRIIHKYGVDMGRWEAYIMGVMISTLLE